METNTYRLLVVDDDPKLRDLVARYLEQASFEVETVGDAQEMDIALSSGTPDLLILDLMLPGEDGLSVARRLRVDGGPPIIMLSARGEDVDRIVGLEMGADDYLPKPFNPRELLARIRAVLRRNNTSHSDDSTSDSMDRPQGIQFGDFQLDLVTRRLLHDAAEVDLTAGDFDLLEVLAQHPNRVLSRDQLVDMIKGYDRSPFDRSIDVRVTRLRRKIEADVAHPSFLRTVWGKGYMFTPHGDRGTA